jgi:hypothetical protein
VKENSSAKPEAKGDVYTYEKVTIPESVALIGKEAFAGCKKLKTVIIKDASYLQYTVLSFTEPQSCCAEKESPAISRGFLFL